MVCILKKGLQSELLNLMMLLSFLRMDPDSFLGLHGHDVSNSRIGDLILGPSWAHTQTVLHDTGYYHPKHLDLDSVLSNYQNELIEELNSLGQYNRVNLLLRERHEIAAYQFVDNTDSCPQSVVSQQAEVAPLGTGASFLDEEPSSPNPEDVELTAEEMNLIELLWKQDEDLGLSRDAFTLPQEDRKQEQSSKEDEESVSSLLSDDPWAGLNFTIDPETGEHIEDLNLTEASPLPVSIVSPTDSTVDSVADLFPDLLRDNTTLQLIDLDGNGAAATEEKEKVTEETETTTVEGVTAAEVGEPSVEQGITTTEEDRTSPAAGDTVADLEFAFDDIDEMIQAQLHPRLQSRVPFMRQMSMDQGWPDMTNVLSLPSPAGEVMPRPYPAYPSTTYNTALIHNASLQGPLGEAAGNSSFPTVSMGATPNLGSAVVTSMNLTNCTEPMPDLPHPVYKIESSQEMYYPNYTAPAQEMSHGAEAMLPVCFEDDLQLMDVSLSESSTYGHIRMLEGSSGNVRILDAPTGTHMHGEERLDTSSDSAISSMGSERVSSISDGEWVAENASEANHTVLGDQASGVRKFDGFEYNNYTRHNSSGGRIPPIAQKKHQMFGRRSLYDQIPDGSSMNSADVHPLPSASKYDYLPPPAAVQYPSHMEGGASVMDQDVKYACSLDLIRSQTEHHSIHGIHHNHTYIPPPAAGAVPRPHTRDKKNVKKEPDENMTRDEKRARSLNIPIVVEDIINLPMDEFNERLSKFDLSEAQLNLIRDIRRRGKNKVAAQNCRKRKLDQIVTLAQEVKSVKDRRLKVCQENEFLRNEHQRLKEKFSRLYHHVFQSLRDPDGNPYSQYEWSLQQSADGSIVLVPRLLQSNSSVPNVVPPDTSHHHGNDDGYHKHRQ